MRCTGIALIVAAMMAASAPALAIDNSPIGQKVGVCNPDVPASCAKPDSSGNMPVALAPSSAASAGLTAVSSAALAANVVVKASAGNLYGFQVSADSTLSAAAWWVMLYDATTAPADGAVTPKKCFAVPSGTTMAAAAWPLAPLAFTTGIVVGVSTAGCFTKTASTHAFISGDAQ